MQTTLGILIIFLMIYLLLKQYDTKMILFGTGILLSLVAGDPLAPLVSFSASMKSTILFETIISSMGFAVIVQQTGCSNHLIAVFIKMLKKMGPFLILGVALATMAVNSAIGSAAGVAAAVGTIMIPLLISSGVPAPIAAASILAGLYGANFNPGHVHPVIVAELANRPSIEFVSVIALPLVASVVVGGVVLMLTMLWMKKRQCGISSVESNASDQNNIKNDFKINYLYAVIPLIPLLMLILGNTVVPILKMPVSHAMILGVIIILIATRSNPSDITKSFFKAMGDAFGSIFGLIITANIFVAGMKSLGLIKSLIDIMTTSPGVAKFAAVFGPFFMAILSGSGEATVVAFNTAVSAHAPAFGMDIFDMGAMTVLSGSIGRSVSPVAACVLVCAGIAKVTPLQIVKYNWPAQTAALLIAAILLIF